jgi:hypothetical protein
MEKLAQSVREKMSHREISRAEFLFSAIGTKFAGRHAAACRTAPILSPTENRRLLSGQAGAAAADKMDYLKLVAILEHCCVPLGTGNDFQIQLHGHAIRLHAELRNQGSNGQAVGEVALFAVDVESHGQLAISQTFLPQRTRKTQRQGISIAN